MQRTLDLVPIEKAIAQAGVPMCTNVAGRVHRAAYFIQRDVESAHFNADHITFRHRIQGRRIDPGKL